jgi:hypothetical protein
MNACKKIKLSWLIIISLISTLILAQTPDKIQIPQANSAGVNRTPCQRIGGAQTLSRDNAISWDPEQMEFPPAADPAVDPNGAEVVNEIPTSLLELVEFYSRKYFKFALDYLFEFLNSLGIFAPDDLASNLNYVDRSAAQFT